MKILLPNVIHMTFSMSKAVMHGSNDPVNVNSTIKINNESRLIMTT